MLPDWVWDEQDHHFMGMALDEARAAGQRGEVPVGAVIVREGAVVARAGNTRQSEHDPAGHAELNAIRQAAAESGDWRLPDCTLYVTLEPCPMCVSACRQARLDLVIWGAPDSVAGACGSVIDLAEDLRLGPPIPQRGGLAAEASTRLLQAFFEKRRRSS